MAGPAELLDTWSNAGQVTSGSPNEYRLKTTDLLILVINGSRDLGFGFPSAPVVTGAGVFPTMDFIASGSGDTPFNLRYYQFYLRGMPAQNGNGSTLITFDGTGYNCTMHLYRIRTATPGANGVDAIVDMKSNNKGSSDSNPNMRVPENILTFLTVADDSAVFAVGAGQTVAFTGTTETFDEVLVASSPHHSAFSEDNANTSVTFTSSGGGQRSGIILAIGPGGEKPWLRQRQRDDIVRPELGRNQPTSEQHGIRTALRNRYQ